MKLQLLFACVCLFASAWLTEEVSSAKSKKTSPKDKSVIPPSIKILPVVKGVKPPVFKGVDKATKEYALVKKSSPNWKTDPGQKAALDKLLTGQEPLTDQERQKLSDLLFNADDAGLTKDDEAALSFLLLDEAARNASATAPTTSPPSEDKAGPS